MEPEASMSPVIALKLTKKLCVGEQNVCPGQ